jgi:alcohol dehydrogenase
MKQNLELRKFVCPEIITGIDARFLAGRYLSNFGAKRPLIVTDSTVKQMSWFEQTVEAMQGVCSRIEIFSNISSNPRDQEVHEGEHIFRERKCDILIAVGGGSPIDCAKGISILAANGGSILDYEGVDMIHSDGPPLICIPSTAGASADVSQFAIICDSYKKLKIAIISKKIVPDLALLDPVPLLTMDPYLTACTGMDALTHAIEAYVSNAYSDLTDVHAEEAIRLISKNIEASVQKNRTVETMYGMMMGSLNAGLAFSNASLGAVHAMAHSLGGLTDAPHGECNSILLEHIIDVNFSACEAKYTRIASLMGIPVKDMTAENIKKALLRKTAELRETLHIPSTKKIDNLSSGLIAELASRAIQDPCLITNPKPLNEEVIREIYERILTQQ